MWEKQDEGGRRAGNSKEKQKTAGGGGDADVHKWVGGGDREVQGQSGFKIQKSNRREAIGRKRREED